jgi:hypothetical protein
MVTGRVILVIALVLAVTAHAEKRNPVEKLAADAAAAYHNGDYQHAVDLLERAYKLQPVSALLYNLAKAYDKLGESQSAADLYAKYAAAEDADPKLKTKAEARLAALILPSHKVDEPVAKPQPKLEPAAKPQPNGEPQPAAQPEAQHEPPRPARPADGGRHRDRMVALGVGVAGVAVLATALGLSLSALHLHDEFSTNLVETDKRQLRNDAQAQALAADLLYAVGVAAAGVTAYFLYRGFRPTRQVAVAPWMQPGAGGLSALGRF